MQLVLYSYKQIEAFFLTLEVQDWRGKKITLLQGGSYVGGEIKFPSLFKHNMFSSGATLRKNIALVKGQKKKNVDLKTRVTCISICPINSSVYFIFNYISTGTHTYTCMPTDMPKCKYTYIQNENFVEQHLLLTKIAEN